MERLEHIIWTMKSLKKTYKNATMIFNQETDRIDIIYPLPKDYNRIIKIK